jgi:hypothetical protein
MVSNKVRCEWIGSPPPAAGGDIHRPGRHRPGAAHPLVVNGLGPVSLLPSVRRSVFVRTPCFRLVGLFISFGDGAVLFDSFHILLISHFFCFRRLLFWMTLYIYSTE